MLLKLVDNNTLRKYSPYLYDIRLNLSNNRKKHLADIKSKLMIKFYISKQYTAIELHVLSLCYRFFDINTQALHYLNNKQVFKHLNHCYVLTRYPHLKYSFATSSLRPNHFEPRHIIKL